MVQESNFYQHLTKDTQRVADGKSRIYYSELNQYYSTNAFRNFSIKLPLQGVVNYRTDKQEYNLAPDQFLLISKQSGKVFFDSGVTVKSICIDISYATFAEAFTIFAGKKEINLENLQAKYFLSPDFFEHVYQVDDSPLGKSLTALTATLKNEYSNEINAETFFNLTEEIVFHQYENFRSMNALLSAKTSTKKEILKRLLKAKHFIDENYLLNPGIAQIAAVANLSEFHFFRSFRQAFSITPYHYMLQKRLEHSHTFIKKGQPLDDVATACSFPDIFSFSKAFKKKYGYPPSFFKVKAGEGSDRV
jgi:AraC family transcriptional regulator